MIGDYTLVQAHRGFSGCYPENTMLAFAEAVNLGADILELDLHISADDEVFVIHDETVDRTTDGSGALKNLKAAEIRSLDAGSWKGPQFAGERIPTFTEVLDTFAGRVKLNIEIKSVTSGYQHWFETLQAALASIAQRGCWDHCMFISFDLQALLAVLEHNSAAFTGFLDWRPGQTLAKQKLLQAAGIRGWHPHPNGATKELVDHAHQLGLFVLCGAGKQLEHLQTEVDNCLAWGVDGVSTNYPDQVIEYLRERGRWKC